MDVAAMVDVVEAHIADLKKEASLLVRGRKARRLIELEINRLERIIEPPLEAEGFCRVCGEPFESNKTLEPPA
jgi:hypothetical protein